MSDDGLRKGDVGRGDGDLASFNACNDPALLLIGLFTTGLIATGLITPELSTVLSTPVLSIPELSTGDKD